jgi:threonine/homoserine/homoserine lactone efflux protein
MITNLAAFLGIAILVIVTPGQDTALTIRNTLVGGRRAGIATGGGVVSGLATWTVASSAGLAALIVASQPLFLAVRLIGAAYLVFLGLQAIRAAFFLRPSPSPSGGGSGWGQMIPSPSGGGSGWGQMIPSPSGGGSGWGLRPLTAFRQGLFSNLSNPKIVVFFLSLLPQFVTRGATAFMGLLLLGAIFCTITLTWLTLYAIVVARIGDFLRRDRIRRAMEATTGLVLVGLGVRLATNPR